MNRAGAQLLFALILTASSSAFAQEEAESRVGPCYSRQELAARTSGFVDEVLLTEGAVVKRGDVIARLDRRIALAGKKEAAAGLRASKASLKLADDARRRLSALKSTDGVTEQELLEAEVRSEQARAAVDQAAAAYDRLKAQLEDTEIVAAFEGKVFGLPKTKGLYVQPGQSLGRVEATTICAAQPIRK